MIEALIGSLIAVIATGGIALMAEVFVQSRGETDTRSLSPYEEEVLSVVSAAHGVAPLPAGNQLQVESWLQQRWNEGL
jgi:hypothetical protein